MAEPTIQVFYELETQHKLNIANISAAAVAIAVDFKKPLHTINIILLNSEEHTSMNKQYLNHDFETDVITFDIGTATESEGEIYINYDVALSNAIEYDVAPLSELYRLVVHGILHLVGMNDETDAQREEMSQKEDYYLTRFM